MFEIYLNQLKDTDLFSDKTAAKIITKNLGRYAQK